MLRQAFPEVTFSLGADQKSIMAWARPDKQTLIRTAVEQIEAAGAPDRDRVMAVYPMRYEDTAALLQVLDPLLQKHATFVNDPKRDGLVVWADKDHQAAIDKAIKDFTSKLPKTREPVSRVYYFASGNPQAALTVLSQVVPAARMAVDPANRSLVVSALPEDQDKVKKTVDEMETTGTGHAPELRAHRISTADPEKLFAMLRVFFRQQPEVQLSLDEENDTIMAEASPKDHDRIRQLIAQVEEGSTGENAAQLAVYPLKDVDSVALMNVLNALLEKQKAKVQLSLDARSDQLVAIARPDRAVDHSPGRRETADRGEGTRDPATGRGRARGRRNGHRQALRGRRLHLRPQPPVGRRRRGHPATLHPRDEGTTREDPRASREDGRDGVEKSGGRRQGQLAGRPVPGRPPGDAPRDRAYLAAVARQPDPNRRPQAGSAGETRRTGEGRGDSAPADSQAGYGNANRAGQGDSQNRAGEDAGQGDAQGGARNVPAKEPPKVEPEKKPVEEPPKVEPEKKPAEEPPSSRSELAKAQASQEDRRTRPLHVQRDAPRVAHSIGRA